MVLQTAPLVALRDSAYDNSISYSLRTALARSALVGPTGNAGAACSAACRHMVREAKPFRMDVQSISERQLYMRQRGQIRRRKRYGHGGRDQRRSGRLSRAPDGLSPRYQ